MQVQSINNNNLNFKAMKGFIYKGRFNPKENLDHAKIVNEVIESPAVKEFAKKYDFIAKFWYDFEKYASDDRYHDEYSLHFSPAPAPAPVESVKKRKQSVLTKFFQRIFSKNENNKAEQTYDNASSSNESIKAEQQLDEQFIQKETCQNLPVEFIVKMIDKVSNDDATNTLISVLKNLTVCDLESALQWEIEYKQEETELKQAKQKLHQELLNKIENFKN